MEGIIVIIVLVIIILALLLGYPVALTLGGLSAIFGLIWVPDFLDLLPLRIMGTMQNPVLMAVPLFVFMGLVLEKSGLAASLLETMAILTHRVKGGLAISVILVGTMLAASTGIVGATVITMGLISLPTMLKSGYDVRLATGTITASGTLGQIIPPSIVLILLGSVLNVSVGDLFAAAIIPGIILVASYILYVSYIARRYPERAPILEEYRVDINAEVGFRRKLLFDFLFPFMLIVLVLGTIFTGVASPTEAAAVGAIGALMLSIVKRVLSLQRLKEVMTETMHITSMVFLILLGATTFSLVFRGLGGDDLLVDFVQKADLSSFSFVLFIMLLVFIAGFFIDFIEIIFIIIPVVYPILIALNIDLVWVGILLALNLQTSFLSPPFGFALFYLKGVAPTEVKTVDIYKGAIPFLVIQVVILTLIFLFPELMGR